jgi:predicted nuclease of predicted toxin-antitoxin system
VRFVVDECTGPWVAAWLASAGHDVVSVFARDRGASDEAVLRRAVEEDRVLVTNDKDFGDRVFRDQETHRGVILLRLEDERAANKITRLQAVLAMFPEGTGTRFIVVTERGVRVANG